MSLVFAWCAVLNNVKHERAQELASLCPPAADTILKSVAQQRWDMLDRLDVVIYRYRWGVVSRLEDHGNR